MFSAQVAFDVDQITGIQSAFVAAPVMGDEAVRKDVVPFVRHAVDITLRVEPPPAALPIQWTPSRHAEDQGKRPNVWNFGAPYYSRQKTAYFATNGFGAGIPYVRQHTLVKAWHVIGDYKGGFGGVRITNDSAKAIYVVGKHQQRFHKNTGWREAASEVQRISLEANERLALAVQRIGGAIARGEAY